MNHIKSSVNSFGEHKSAKKGEDDWLWEENKQAPWQKFEKFNFPLREDNELFDHLRYYF